MLGAALLPFPVPGFFRAPSESPRLRTSRHSLLAALAGGKEVPLTLGQDAILSSRVGEPGKVDAPMVFVGYGLCTSRPGPPCQRKDWWRTSTWTCSCPSCPSPTWWPSGRRSREERLQKQWYRERYHAPSDDLAQPVDKEGAAKFVRLLADLARTVADATERPRWNEASFFRRFARSEQGTNPPVP